MMVHLCHYFGYSLGILCKCRIFSSPFTKLPLLTAYTAAGNLLATTSHLFVCSISNSLREMVVYTSAQVINIILVFGQVHVNACAACHVNSTFCINKFQPKNLILH